MAGQGAIAWWGPDGKPLGRHIIGDSLILHLSGVAPNESFVLVLEDEAARTVVELDVSSSSKGLILPVVLWNQTGVVGCDASAGFTGLYPDHDRYRYAGFDEVETSLDRRTFRLRLLETNMARELAATDLELFADGLPRFFFSDKDGCLRFLMADEQDVYVTGRQIPRNLTSVSVFLMPGKDGWVEGTSFEDVREQYQDSPEVIEIGPSDSFTKLAWSCVFSKPGSFGGFVRKGEDSPASIVLKDSWWMKGKSTDPGSTNGLTILDVPLGIECE